MMRKLVSIAAVAAVSVNFAGAAYAASFSLQPGKYTMMGKMTMPMMPNGMPINNTYCVTEEQTNMKAEDIAEQMAAGSDCTIADLNMTDTKMKFNFTCSGGEMGTVTGDYDINFSRSAYTVVGNIGASGMSMQMQGQASRIGDC